MPVSVRQRTLGSRQPSSGCCQGRGAVSRRSAGPWPRGVRHPSRHRSARTPYVDNRLARCPGGHAPGRHAVPGTLDRPCPDNGDAPGSLSRPDHDQRTTTLQTPIRSRQSRPYRQTSSTLSTRECTRGSVSHAGTHSGKTPCRKVTSRVMCQGDWGTDSLGFVFVDEDRVEDAVH